VPDPIGVLLQRSEGVTQLILVIESRGIVFKVKSPDGLNEVGIRAVDPSVNGIDGAAGAAGVAGPAGPAVLRRGEIVNS